MNQLVFAFYMLVGTYTGTGSDGIYVYGIDPETAHTEYVGMAKVDNPSYLTVSEDGRMVYAVGENDGIPVNVAVAHGLANARQLVEEMKTGKSKYHFIEVMACPGGCIGGGGQPYHRGDIMVLRERQASIYAEDAAKALRKSHENPFILKLYAEYLGAPGGHVSHELLHTAYVDRKPAACPSENCQNKK